MDKKDKNDDQGMQEKIEAHNRRAMIGSLTIEDISDLKRLLGKYDELIKLADRYEAIEDAMKAHERIKWILRSVAVGAPILVAIWQLIDRFHK